MRHGFNIFEQCLASFGQQLTLAVTLEQMGAEAGFQPTHPPSDSCCIDAKRLGGARQLTSAGYREKSLIIIPVVVLHKCK